MGDSMGRHAGDKVLRSLLAVPLAAGLAFGAPAALAPAAIAEGDGQGIAEALYSEDSSEQVAAGYLSVSKGYATLNKFRKSHHRKALKKNAKLVKTAKVRAKELAKRYAHTRPNGKRCFTAYPKSRKRAENIARGQTNVVWATEKWESTSGHRKNMLRKTVNAVGIAGYRAADGTCYWVQCFAWM